MPTAALKAMALKADKPVEKAEEYWEAAKKSAAQKFKKEDPRFWAYVMGIVKRRLGLSLKEGRLTFMEFYGDTSGRYSPLTFPPLSDEEKLYLQGLVHDNLEVGRQPSTEQLRMIAKLMKLRLMRKEPNKYGEMKYRVTPWGMELVGMMDSSGTKSLTARSSPHM